MTQNTILEESTEKVKIPQVWYGGAAVDILGKLEQKSQKNPYVKQVENSRGKTRPTYIFGGTGSLWGWLLGSLWSKQRSFADTYQRSKSRKWQRQFGMVWYVCRSRL